MFGFETSIPLYSAEEEALCDQFHPLWNRAKFPGKTKKTRNKVGVSEAIQDSQEIRAFDQSIDFSEMARGDNANSFYMSLENEDRNHFLEILSFIMETPELAMLQQKIIGGYTDQPQGYSGVPMINYALMHNSGRAVGNSWGIRVPLINSKSSPLTVIFPKKYLSPACDPSAIEWGSNDSFRPKDLNDFIKNKAKYIVI